MHQQKRINSYLTFKLGPEEFALNADKVLNTLDVNTITKVPKAPSYIKGVINLRGNALPIIDTRLKWGMPKTKFTESTCIIVLELNISNKKVMAGILVDEVRAVLDIANSQVEPPPSIGSTYRSEFITGIAKSNDSCIMLLDMEKGFSNDEFFALKDELSEAK